MKHTDHTEAPYSFHKWTAISTIAGALRRRVWIDLGTFTWIPNFFIFFVAPPGVVSKSTTVNIGMDLLRELDYIKFGPASVTWQALVTRMQECHEEVITPDGEFVPMSCITIVASELGTFLDPRNGDMINVLTDLWDGRQGVWDKLTKTMGGDKVVNPWINIIGCTTPAWVADNFSDYFIGGGLASRSIFVYAETKRKLVAYPQRHIPPNFKENAQDLVEDLHRISDLYGEFKISEDAFDWGEIWYEEHNLSSHPHIAGEKFQGYLARKQTHIHKLAMVLSAAESDDLIITREHLKLADKEVTVIESDMPRVFNRMNRETEMILAADVLEAVRKVRKVKKITLYSEFFQTMSYDTFERIIKSLMQAGLAKQGQSGNELFIEVSTPSKSSDNDSEAIG